LRRRGVSLSPLAGGQRCSFVAEHFHDSLVLIFAQSSLNTSRFVGISERVGNRR